MFKLTIISGGREIHIEIPIADDRYLDGNVKSAIEIIKAASEEILKLNE